ncbi:hypothetical protein [Pseudomonas pseudonitroreducens]|uniref:hypothetical protein n=1 Tax=Pseudomonas pseudonitroreducens TaxID=2892326 RepID=UPI001F16280F|nr:hypothetical protein [Pseudomonas pseudonitroreducens]
MEWLILFWLVIGALTAAAAGSKNRSRLGWFFLGLMFPLPALLIVVAFPPKPSPEKLAEERDSRPCPFCAESIKKAAVKCKHCGSTVEADLKPALTDRKGAWLVTIPCKPGQELLEALAKLKELGLPVIPSESAIISIGPYETKAEAGDVLRRLSMKHYLHGNLDYQK